MISDEALLAKAIEAQQHAYARYSNFNVGAALLTRDGQIFSGANIENASYGLAMCAERTAIFAAVNAGVRQFVKMAVVCDCQDGCLPCGACRQVIAEFAPNLPMILGNPDGQYQTTSLSELLPKPFLPDHLKQ